jgi:biotin synthase
MPYTYQYARPALTVDCVIFGLVDAGLTGSRPAAQMASRTGAPASHEWHPETPKVLLIQRGREPFVGCWALPGGFVEVGETVEQAARRELEEETGLAGVRLEQLHTFSEPDRDPREHVVSVVHYGLVNIRDCRIRAADDARKADWFPVDDLPPLAFDHEKILRMAIERMEGVLFTDPSLRAAGAPRQKLGASGLGFRTERGQEAGKMPVLPEGAARRSGRWQDLAERVLEGHELTHEEGLAILRSGDEELLDVLSAAYRVRYHWHGRRVHLNFLVNAKSGRCGEDCAYCSQSGVSAADVPKYDLVDPQEILDGARLAAQYQAGTYCIVISGRGPLERDIDRIAEVVPRIRQQYDLRICVSAGLLAPEQAARLKACGVNRINHNLNTSQRFYPRICTTHTYEERLATLRAVREAGLEICSGGIVGMGEENVDVVELALRLGELKVEAVPINFLIPIPGTPLEGARPLNPRYCLKVLVLARMANPRCELRIAAGREIHLGALQPLGLYAADSIFVGDYLTTKGQPPEDDLRMIEALGLEIVRKGPESSPT